MKRFIIVATGRIMGREVFQEYIGPFLSRERAVKWLVENGFEGYEHESASCWKQPMKISRLATSIWPYKTSFANEVIAYIDIIHAPSQVRCEKSPH